jgi:hypothetical protein
LLFALGSLLGTLAQGVLALATGAQVQAEQRRHQRYPGIDRRVEGETRVGGSWPGDEQQ